MIITVFLADDHAVVRDGLRLMLEGQEDIHVIGDAANGQDAVNQVAQLCPDVVVMDIGMPKVDGISRWPPWGPVAESMRSNSRAVTTSGRRA